MKSLNDRTRRYFKSTKWEGYNKPAEQIRKEQAKIHTAFQVFDALEKLATMPLKPDVFMAAVRKDQRYRINEHLDDAYAWLNDFYTAWRTST